MAYPDLVQAAIDAVFVRLRNQVPAQLATVRVTAAQDAQPPLILCGDVDFVNIGSKEDPIFDIALQLQHVSRGAGRAGVLALMSASFSALHDQDLVQPDGISLSSPEIEAGSTGSAADGVTFAGIQSFKIMSEPA